MSKKTITKLFAFVICYAFAIMFLGGCSRPASGGPETTSRTYDKPKIVGKYENPAIKESSGIAASMCQEGVYWTHNDSGDGPFIFALDLTGKNLGTWRVANAQNIDWEDISSSRDAGGKCYLYLGEIGDNEESRPDVAIYRVAEPTVAGPPASNRGVPETEPASILRFRYPDGPRNAEALLIDRRSGSFYILTKRFDAPSSVFRLKAVFDAPEVSVAEKVTEIVVPSVPNGLLTGAATSPDGTRVMISDYTNGYELILPQGAESFDEIWKQKPETVDLGERKQGEGVTYSPDGRSVVASSEKKGAALNQITRSN